MVGEGRQRVQWATSSLKNVVITVCLEKDCKLQSPGILNYSPNVLRQRNWSHRNTNKLDFAAHLQCMTWHWAPWAPQTGGRGFVWIQRWQPSVVKLGLEQETEGKLRTISVIDRFLMSFCAAAGQWIGLYICQLWLQLELRNKKKGNVVTMVKKHKYWQSERKEITANPVEWFRKRVKCKWAPYFWASRLLNSLSEPLHSLSFLSIVV